jgi:hypothetical protein
MFCTGGMNPYTSVISPNTYLYLHGDLYFVLGSVSDFREPEPLHILK